MGFSFSVGIAHPVTHAILRIEFLPAPSMLAGIFSGGSPSTECDVFTFTIMLPWERVNLSEIASRAVHPTCFYVASVRTKNNKGRKLWAMWSKRPPLTFCNSVLSDFSRPLQLQSCGLATRRPWFCMFRIRWKSKCNGSSVYMSFPAYFCDLFSPCQRWSTISQTWPIRWLSDDLLHPTNA